MSKEYKKFLFIPITNRAGLGKQAYDSVSDYRGEIRVLDNTDGKENLFHTKCCGYQHQIAPMKPQLPFNMMQNQMRYWAISRGYDYYMFMHNDGVLEDSRGLQGFTEYVESLDQDKWGVVFSHYDVLCAYNTKAMIKAGPWDWFLQWYFADNDMYRRIFVTQGFERHESGFKVLHQNSASNTLKADPVLSARNGVTFPLWGQYYKARWGGDPGKETLTVPAF